MSKLLINTILVCVAFGFIGPIVFLRSTRGNSNFASKMVNFFLAPLPMVIAAIKIYPKVEVLSHIKEATSLSMVKNELKLIPVIIATVLVIYAIGFLISALVIPMMNSPVSMIILGLAVLFTQAYFLYYLGMLDMLQLTAVSDFINNIRK